MVSADKLLARLEQFGTRLGLDSTQGLLRRLGSPEKGMAVTLVAGTNGKGSTAALLAAIVTAAGYRTGLYTSPHLESVRERVRIDGVSIRDDALAAALEKVLAVGESDGEPRPTYFEALTVAALLHFADEGVEMAILEVGLGGRLDATNATEPVLSVISEIGLDHQEHLGESLAEIAGEKAGIMRRGRPTLAWVSEPEARAALSERAAEISADLDFISGDHPVRFAGDGSSESRTETTGQRLAVELRGDHQKANLSLAVAGANSLAAAGWHRIDAESVRDGVAACRWPGRLEWVDLADRGRVLLDGAHNPQAAAALARYLTNHPDGYTLLFGAMRDKDSASMLPVLAECAERVALTRVMSSRTSEPRDLARLLPGRRPRILARATDALAPELMARGPLVVCGSLYLVGEVRVELRRRFGVPTAAAETLTSLPAAG